MDRQTDRQTDRQINRQTNGQPVKCSRVTSCSFCWQGMTTKIFVSLCGILFVAFFCFQICLLFLLSFVPFCFATWTPFHVSEWSTQARITVSTAAFGGVGWSLPRIVQVLFWSILTDTDVFTPGVSPLFFLHAAQKQNECRCYLDTVLKDNGRVIVVYGCNFPYSNGSSLSDRVLYSHHVIRIIVVYSL